METRALHERRMRITHGAQCVINAMRSAHIANTHSSGRNVLIDHATCRMGTVRVTPGPRQLDYKMRN